ncbi:MAG TPA: SDR family NAD(P)-dependent oxidoreductase [Chitinophagaceae bacterium]
MHSNVYTLVTGASEGFGKALSIECARRGMNLILVALPGEELKSLKNYIEKNYAVKAIYFEADLSNNEECSGLFASIREKELQVNILINNAGIGGTHGFEERDAAYYQRLIALNVVAPTLLTHFFLPMLRAHNRSFILNVSSMAGLFVVPNKQVYGGTKSYLLAFSRSLRRELKDKNVSVSTICPGGMNTTLAQIVRNQTLSGIGRWSVMNPENVASVAIESMLRGSEIIIPGRWNRFIVFLNMVLPGIIKDILKKRMDKNVFASQHKGVPIPLIENWRKAG